MPQIQKNSGTVNGVTNIVPTLGSATTAGNSILIFVQSAGTLSTPSGFVSRSPQVNQQGLYLFEKLVASGNSTDTPTMAQGGTFNATWAIFEYSSMTAFDVSSGNNSGNVANGARATPSITPASGNKLIFGYVGNTAAQPTTYGGTDPTSWTNSFVSEGSVQLTGVVGSGRDSLCQGVATLQVAANGATSFSTAATVTASNNSSAPATIIAAYTHSASVAADPFNKTSHGFSRNILELTPQHFVFNPNLFTNPIPFSKTDWSIARDTINPPAPQHHVRNPLLYPNPIPFAQYDWYNPKDSLPTPLSTPQQPYNLSLYNPTVVSAPFSQTQWPIPNALNPRVPQPPTNVPLLDYQSTPFKPVDWSSRFMRPDGPDGLQQTNINLFTNPIPFAQLDWSKTEFLQPRAPDQQNYNLAIAFVPPTPPFAQLDWSTTKFQKPRAPDASQSTSINLLPDTTQAMVFDWSGSAPLIRPRAPDAPVYNLSLYTVVAVAAPFYQTDWTPAKFARLAEVDATAQTNINLFQATPNPQPFAQTDWSTTRFARPPLSDASRQTNINVFTNPIPFSKTDWLFARGLVGLPPQALPFNPNVFAPPPPQPAGDFTFPFIANVGSLMGR